MIQFLALSISTLFMTAAVGGSTEAPSSLQKIQQPDSKKPKVEAPKKVQPKKPVVKLKPQVKVPPFTTVAFEDIEFSYPTAKSWELKEGDGWLRNEDGKFSFQIEAEPPGTGSLKEFLENQVNMKKFPLRADLDWKSKDPGVATYGFHLYQGANQSPDPLQGYFLAFQNKRTGKRYHMHIYMPESQREQRIAKLKEIVESLKAQ